jgi:hypothetical protein
MELAPTPASQVGILGHAPTGAPAMIDARVPR